MLGESYITSWNIMSVVVFKKVIQGLYTKSAVSTDLINTKIRCVAYTDLLAAGRYKTQTHIWRKGLAVTQLLYNSYFISDKHQSNAVNIYIGDQKRVSDLLAGEIMESQLWPNEEDKKKGPIYWLIEYQSCIKQNNWVYFIWMRRRVSLPLSS